MRLEFWRSLALADLREELCLLGMITDYSVFMAGVMAMLVCAKNQPWHMANKHMHGKPIQLIERHAADIADKITLLHPLCRAKPLAPSPLVQAWQHLGSANAWRLAYLASFCLDCPHTGAIRAQCSFCQDAGGSVYSVHLFMWRRDQKAVSHCLSAY